MERTRSTLVPERSLPMMDDSPVGAHGAIPDDVEFRIDNGRDDAVAPSVTWPSAALDGGEHLATDGCVTHAEHDLAEVLREQPGGGRRHHGPTGRVQVVS